jgi:tripartite ATP-independent transporter DctP family solute receptor
MMKMKKNWKAAIFVLVCFALGSMAMVGCGGAKKDAATGDGKKPVVMRFAHTVVTDHSIHKAALFFAEKVKEKTKGQVEIKVFPGGQMGGEKAQAEGMMAGTLDFTMASTAVLSNWLPQWMALDLPYLISNEAQAEKMLAGDVGKYLTDLLPGKGLYGLGWGENGFRHFSNSSRPLHIPADMKGLKIRVMENRLMIDTMKSWGADPTPIPFTEVYTALQQKTVDGQENPLPLIEQMRFYEVQKYLTMSYHFYSPFLFYASKVNMDKLSPENQQAIREAAKEALAFQIKLGREDQVKSLAIMEKAGVQVNRLNEAELKQWKEKVQPIYGMYKDKMGVEIYEKIMAATKQ